MANQTLWSEVLDKLSFPSISSIGYLLTLLCLMVLLLAIPIFVVGQRWILKPLLVALLLSSATLAYFTQQLGVVFDVEMVRNITEAVRDRNTQEARELVSLPLVNFVVLTTGAPVAFVVSLRIRYRSILKDQIVRLGYCLCLILVASTLVFFNFKYVTYFSRENNDLEVYLTPLYAFKTINSFVQRQRQSSALIFNELAADAHQDKPGRERVVGVMVVGETARSDHFGLNGYDRNTTPELSKKSVINFSNATSCGTSTAFSVPCMFSFMRQVDYSPEQARQQSNALDVLQSSGVETIWVDSNSSCKGVCKRIESENILRSADRNSVLFVDGAWHDEKLLEYLGVYLDRSDRDVLLVLHAMGSHGPAYYRRFPSTFNRYTPFCQSKAPQECSSELIVNAYDNTIAYTDHVLSRIIEELDARDEASFMLYASDHGESLGENGIFLHGLPRFLAPEAQLNVPVVAWFSEEYKRYKKWPDLPPGVLQKTDAISHDNLSSSLLGLYDIRADEYRDDLDLFNFQAY